MPANQQGGACYGAPSKEIVMFLPATKDNSTRPETVAVIPVQKQVWDGVKFQEYTQYLPYTDAMLRRRYTQDKHVPLWWLGWHSTKAFMQALQKPDEPAHYSLNVWFEGAA